MSLPIDTILVPQGPEYQAVCQGIRHSQGKLPTVIPVPAGTEAIAQYLQRKETDNFLNCSQSKVLVMGLCGGLSGQYAVGDVVIYQNCLDLANFPPVIQQACDRHLTDLLYRRLQESASLVTGITSDRPICAAAEKQDWGKRYQGDVVDMEGFAVLKVLNSVAMVRVVSDDCYHDLPDLTSAIGSDGSLRPFPLAMAMVQQPLKAVRLIRGSLKALQVLQQVTTDLFSGI